MRDLYQYESLKHLMATGDLVEWKGNSLIAKAIMARTGHEASHCSVVVLLPYEGCDRRYIIEAKRTGLEFNLLSKSLQHFNGSAYWLRLKEEFDHLRPSMGKWLFDCLSLGTGYDFPALFQQIFRRAVMDDKLWFCSEISEANYIVHGILKPDPDGVRYPGEFTREGIFLSKATILGN
jgi:hypothetical protein